MASYPSSSSTPWSFLRGDVFPLSPSLRWSEGETSSGWRSHLHQRWLWSGLDPVWSKTAFECVHFCSLFFFPFLSLCFLLTKGLLAIVLVTFPHCWDKYLTPKSWRRKSLFSSQFVEVSVHISWLQGRVAHGREPAIHGGGRQQKQQDPKKGKWTFLCPFYFVHTAGIRVVSIQLVDWPSNHSPLIPALHYESITDSRFSCLQKSSM